MLCQLAVRSFRLKEPAPLLCVALFDLLAVTLIMVSPPLGKKNPFILFFFPLGVRLCSLPSEGRGGIELKYPSKNSSDD